MNMNNKSYAQGIYGDEPTTMDELAKAVIKVINEFQHNRLSKVGRKTVITPGPKAKCIGFSWDVVHYDSVSNSHNSPEGYPDNFMQKPESPKGYPGWYGRVWVRYETEKNFCFSSDTFKRTLTHTGTGGFGSYNGPWAKVATARYNRLGHINQGTDAYPGIMCYSWDFKIFDYDWPLITEVIEHEKATVWAHLNDKPEPARPHHRFHWEDPKTVEADHAFMLECERIREETL
jgi:hypothetical protein